MNFELSQTLEDSELKRRRKLDHKVYDASEGRGKDREGLGSGKRVCLILKSLDCRIRIWFVSG